jgi:hypothetical protein
MINSFLDVANLSQNCGTVRNVKRHMANQNCYADLQRWMDLLNRRAFGSASRHSSRIRGLVSAFYIFLVGSLCGLAHRLSE